MPRVTHALGILSLVLSAILSGAITLACPLHSEGAQIGGGGSIQGMVLDASGAALPGATVTATNIATGVETRRQTTQAGVYALSPLQPGDYRDGAT